MQEGEVISHPWVSKSIERSQKAVEGHNFDIRKHLLEYDDVMNKQRERIYKERNRVLHEGDIRSHMIQIVEDVAADGVEVYMPEKSKSDEWDIPGLMKWYRGIFQTELVWNLENIKLMDREGIFKALQDEMVKAYETKEKALTPQVMRTLERAILLEVIDNQWKDHLLSMDHMKEGIGLQSYGGKDPLIEYKREGLSLFMEMLGRIEEDTLKLIFLVQTVKSSDQLFGQAPSVMKEEHPEFDYNSAMAQQPAPQPVLVAPGLPPGMGPPPGMEQWQAQGSQPQPQAKVAPFRREGPKVGRNEPCWCGSGKKFKKCHGT